MKKIRPFFGIAARAGLVAAVFVGLFLFPAQAHADRTITSVTLNGASSVTVAPGATIAAAVNVTTDGSGSNARWRSTGWSISATAPGAVTCVDHPNHDGAGAYSETFSITAPATSGTYNAYFIGYNNDSCSSGASATRTMTNAVIVTGAAPPTATTNAASAVTPYVATLNGTVSSNGASTAVSFEYGLTTSYGYSTTPSTSLADDAVNAAVSDDLIGLNCNTTFHYRVKATNSAGTAYGADQTFTTGACTAPFPATACAATRFNGDLGCTANDVNITDITLAPTGQQSSCVSGTPVTLDLDMTVNFSSPDRWDVGIFIANDGKLPTLLPANGGASSCSVAVLPIIPETGSYTFPDLDGLPQGTVDTCGDGNGAINGGTGSGVKRMTGVTIPCYATPDSGGKLFVPFVVSWDNQKSPIGGICTSNQYPVPNTTSKCNAPLSSVPINVVVMPKINKTHSGASFNPGDPITYTITVFNDSGGTLQASFFKDPVVANLAVTGLSCAAANGATCPTTNNTVADMQGPTGIPIPSANLPNNSSLIFTVTGTLSGVIGTTIDNTATISIGLNTNSSTDSVTLGAASGSKSFAPDSITEGNNSLMTITFTNPTAFAVTGVSFLDTYPAGLVNAASPGESTTCSGTVTAIGGGNTFTFSGGTIPATGSCTVSVYVTSATANSYINSVSFTSGSHGSLGLASATLGVTAPVFGAFNACDDATDPNFSCTNTTTPTTSRITTKIAGVPFTLDLVALNSNGSWNSSYSNDVIVELLDSSNNSGAFDANNCRSSWTTVIATLGSFPDFGSSNGQITTLTSFTVPEAYRDVRVRVRNNGGATRVGCSTDNFAIRPNNLEVIPTDTDWQTTGTARTINNTDATSPGSQASTPNPIHKAGQLFTVTATAKNASNVTTANYNVTVAPAAALSDCSTPPPPSGGGCTASFGIFSLGAGSAASGVVTWSSASYSEVGAFDLTLQDTDFTSVDAADTAASCAGRYVCGTAAVGRFVPDHFDLSNSAIVNRSDINAGAGCSPASTFTYMGEAMKASFTLTAKNAGGNPTQNYAGSFAKFTNSIANWIADTGNDRVGLWAIATDYTYGGSTCKVLFDRVTPSVNSFVACSGAVPTLLIGRTAGPRVTVSSPSLSAWANGAATFTADATLERGDAPDGSYATLNIGATPQDADGVALSAYDLDADNSGTPERASLGTTEVRFGRLKLSNAHGSELLNLPVPVQAQYWNGTAFVPNEADNCTVLASTNIALGNYQRKAGDTWTTSPTLANAVAIQGGWQVSLSKPSPTPSGKGSVDLCVDLGGDPVGGTLCSATVPANLPYLQGLWSPGASYNNDPKVRATFGVFKGNDEFIYLREMY